MLMYEDDGKVGDYISGRIGVESEKLKISKKKSDQSEYKGQILAKSI